MKIYYPKKEHLYTIIMLHGMYCDNTSFDMLVSSILKNNEHVKIILPNASVRDIDWPNGKEKNVNSWYNYFTCKDGELEHDTIDINQYNSESKKIKRLIEQERNYINYSNIILLGESQGGTIVSKLALEIEEQIGGFLLIDTVFMDSILIPIVKYPNIYIYSSECDEVYILELQKNSIKKLNLENYIVEWYVDKGVQHSDYGPGRDKFILKTISKIFT
tara:strand:+ start:4501 stop:5154 length:654 start_codon:yes stop_codon:yes gene_type:complete